MNTEMTPEQQALLRFANDTAIAVTHLLSDDEWMPSEVYWSLDRIMDELADIRAALRAPLQEQKNA